MYVLRKESTYMSSHDSGMLWFKSVMVKFLDFQFLLGGFNFRDAIMTRLIIEVCGLLSVSNKVQSLLISQQAGKIHRPFLV